MVNCFSCNQKVGGFFSFSDKYELEDSEGNVNIFCKYCYKAELEKQKKAENTRKEFKQKEAVKELNKLNKELEESKKTCSLIKTKIKTLFENKQEQNYAEEIMNYFLSNKDLKDVWFQVEFIPTDPVGYKSKVLKKLRELEILHKENTSYTTNIVINLEEQEIKKLNKVLDAHKLKYFFEVPYDEETKGCTLSYFFKPKEYSEKLLEKINKGIEIDNKLKEDKKGKRFVCSDCEYKWETTKKFGEPFKCPKCNSKNIVSFKKLKELIK